jgi:hypothetical protein
VGQSFCPGGGVSVVGVKCPGRCNARREDKVRGGVERRTTHKKASKLVHAAADTWETQGRKDGSGVQSHAARGGDRLVGRQDIDDGELDPLLDVLYELDALLHGGGGAHHLTEPRGHPPVRANDPLARLHQWSG